MHFFGLNLTALHCASVSPTSAVRFLHSERRGSEMEKSLSLLKHGHMAPGGEQSVRSPRPQSDIFVVCALCLQTKLSFCSSCFYADHASFECFLALSLTHTLNKKKSKRFTRNKPERTHFLLTHYQNLISPFPRLFISVDTRAGIASLCRSHISRVVHR